MVGLSAGTHLVVVLLCAPLGRTLSPPLPVTKTQAIVFARRTIHDIARHANVRKISHPLPLAIPQIPTNRLNSIRFDSIRFFISFWSNAAIYPTANRIEFYYSLRTPPTTSTCVPHQFALPNSRSSKIKLKLINSPSPTPTVSLVWSSRTLLRTKSETNRVIGEH